MFTVVSICILRRGNKNCGYEDVFWSVKDLIDNDINKEDFDRWSEILIKN